MRKIELSLLALVLVVATLLRLPLVLQGFFAFTYDQGRDMLAVKDIVSNHKISLTCPTTGLPGIFYGPWWYYSLVPLFIISAGDPVKISVAFAFLGILTVLFVYFITKKIITSKLITLFIAYLSAVSSAFLIASNQVWNPSLVVPLMLLYVFILSKLLTRPTNVLYFIFGLIIAFIFDFQAAFGLMLTLATVISCLFFRKSFHLKFFILLALAFLIVLSPRVIFDLRHDFLITKALTTWISNPSVYQEKLTILQRSINRLDLFYLNFAQTFAAGNKTYALLPLAVLIVSLFRVRRELIKQKLFKFLITLLLIIYFGFVIYKDAVWDYYLVGLPLVTVFLAAIILDSVVKKSKFIAIAFIILVFVFSFNSKIFSPFSITWQGDGAIYRNQKNVLDTIKANLHGQYSLYVYTPARFDYPFDYLTWWYINKGQIDPPREGAKNLSLIIRDDKSHSYLTSGWYGDKTRDKTKVLERRDFPGNLIYENHQRND